MPPSRSTSALTAPARDRLERSSPTRNANGTARDQRDQRRSPPSARPRAPIDLRDHARRRPATAHRRAGPQHRRQRAALHAARTRRQRRTSTHAHADQHARSADRRTAARKPFAAVGSSPDDEEVLRAAAGSRSPGAASRTAAERLHAARGRTPSRTSRRSSPGLDAARSGRRRAGGRTVPPQAAEQRAERVDQRRRRTPAARRRTTGTRPTSSAARSAGRAAATRRTGRCR